MWGAGVWKFLLGFLSEDAFTFIIISLMGMVDCQPAEASNTRVLGENHSMVCWADDHVQRSALVFPLLLVYLLGAVVYHSSVLLRR